MGSAIIGLVGGLLGAAIALFGSVLTARLQARQEARRWERDRRQAAYDGALRYLLRAANRRSEVAVASGGRVVAVMSEEHFREWFDDLVEAQFWLHSLTGCCGSAQLNRLQAVAEFLDESVASFMNGTRRSSEDDVQTILRSETPTVVAALNRAIQTVTDCARHDGRGATAA